MAIIQTVFNTKTKEFHAIMDGIPISNLQEISFFQYDDYEMRLEQVEDDNEGMRTRITTYANVHLDDKDKKRKKRTDNSI